MRNLVPLLALLLTACSSVQTSGLVQSAPTFDKTERIELRVQTGNPQIDRILYEAAFQQFSDVMPLREREPYSGTFDLTFTSTTQSAFVGSSSSTSSYNGTVTGWYGPSNYSAALNGSSNTATVSSGSVFNWQNSVMTAILRDSDGERLWSATYDYKGGWEMSGYTVNTPAEAAVLVAKRLKKQYVKDLAGGH